MKAKGEHGLLLWLRLTSGTRSGLSGFPEGGKSIPHQGWMWESVPASAERLKQSSWPWAGVWEPEGVLSAALCPRGHEEKSVFSGQRHVSLDPGKPGAARVTLHGAFNCVSPVVLPSCAALRAQETTRSWGRMLQKLMAPPAFTG